VSPGGRIHRAVKQRWVIFGLTVSSSWGNGHATLWRSLLPALARRGHEVVFFEKDLPYYARQRDLRAVRYADLRLYRSWELVRSAALRLAAQADVVMVTSYCPEGATILDDVLSLVRPQRVFYDLDTPVTLAGLAARDPMTLSYLRPEQVPALDLVLSFTGGPLLEELRARWRARRAEALYLCIDPQRYRPVAPQMELRNHLSFLGTYAPDRLEKLKLLLFAPARQLKGARFALVGAQYPGQLQVPRNVFRVEHLAPRAHPGFYAASRFTLNLTRTAMQQAGYSPQGRLFEAACCGTPVITDPWPGLELFFDPEREIQVADSAAAVCKILEMPSADRKTMAKRARSRVLAEHTGARRAQELERLVEGG